MIRSRAGGPFFVPFRPAKNKTFALSRNLGRRIVSATLSLLEIVVLPSHPFPAPLPFQIAALKAFFFPASLDRYAGGAMVEVAGGTKVSPAPLPLYEFRKGGTPSNKTDKKGGSRDSRKKGAIWEDLKMAMERGGRASPPLLFLLEMRDLLPSHPFFPICPEQHRSPLGRRKKEDSSKKKILSWGPPLRPRQLYVCHESSPFPPGPTTCYYTRTRPPSPQGKQSIQTNAIPPKPKTPLTDRRTWW